MPCLSAFGKRLSIWISESATSYSVSVFAGRKMQCPLLQHKGMVQLLAGNNLLLLAEKCRIR